MQAGRQVGTHTRTLTRQPLSRLFLGGYHPTAVRDVSDDGAETLKAEDFFF